MKTNSSESKIVELLGEKHTNDVFVPHCKDGSTWRGGIGILDAWAMKRTWNPITMIGYEIKVSRGDFINDRKWIRYLDSCHELYFVCPWKLISPDELPTGVGLMWVNRKNSGLYTKKKAARRQVEPYNVLVYILMSRSRICNSFTDVDSTEEYWRKWLREKKDKKILGHRVAYWTSKIVSEYRQRTREAENMVKKYDGFIEKLKSHGIDPNCSEWFVDREVDRAIGAIPREVITRLRSLADELEKIKGDP